jgi:transposase
MGWRRGQTYSQDLRDRVLAADDLSARQAAARFAVSVSYGVKARQRRARTDAATPRPQKPPTARLLVPWPEAIAARVRPHPETTIAGLRAWLLGDKGVSASMGTVWKALSQLGLTLKKVTPGRRTGARRCGCGAPALTRAPAQADPGQAGLPR